MNRQASDLVNLFVKEGSRRLLTLTTMFSVIAVIALGIDLLVPKKWDASALIVVESSNIIKPLMEGRAVATGVTDQTALVTQVIQSKRILRELLADGEWTKNKKLGAADELTLLNGLRARIHIEPAKEQTIRISFSDSDARRTELITNKIAEIYVRESMNLKEQESREAFNFVSERVKEYRNRLTEDHRKLLAYYRGQTHGTAEVALAAETLPPSAAAPTDEAPSSSTHGHATLSPDELAELRAEEATLNAQLGRKSPAPLPTESIQAEELYRSRVLQLQNDLDRMRVTYTDEHPDVKRARRDLEIAKDQLHHAEQARTDRETARTAATALDDELTRAARTRLEEVQAKIAAATGVHRHAARVVQATRHVVANTAVDDPEMKGVGQDTTLSELSQRYEATRDVYEDLLKRRENARVSMDLDAERRGLTMRIEEAAELPVVASGLRLFQLSLIGLFIAALVPFGYLFAIVKLDSRVRSAEQIERVARVPLLVTIPGAQGQDPRRTQNRSRFAAAMVAGVFVVYVAVFLARLKMT